MEMDCYELLVIFTDGKEKIISRVTDAAFNDGIFKFKKNGYWGFLPMENVKYFGRKFDWES